MNSVVDASGCLAAWMDASSSAKDGSMGVSMGVEFEMGANLVSSSKHRTILDMKVLK